MPTGMLGRPYYTSCMISHGMPLFVALTFLASITPFMTSSSTKREGSPDLYSTLMYTTTCDCWRTQQKRKMNLMQGRLWNGVITREISISSLHLAGRFAIHLLASTKVSNYLFAGFRSGKELRKVYYRIIFLESSSISGALICRINNISGSLIQPS